MRRLCVLVVLIPMLLFSAGQDVNVKAGTKGHLQFQKGQDAFVSIDRETLEILLKATVAKDVATIMGLYRAKKAFLVADGIEIQAIRVQPGPIAEIKVLQGEFAGKTGWVPVRWIKP